jgi:hypothetical protein
VVDNNFSVKGAISTLDYGDNCCQHRDKTRVLGLYSQHFIFVVTYEQVK